MSKQPAAKATDQVTATDTHLLNGTPTPMPFSGKLDTALSPNVKVEHKYAAMVGSIATNSPAHAAPKGKSFDKPPSNKGVVVGGSGTVYINRQHAARNDDPVQTCNDPNDLAVGKIVATSTVKIGD